MHNNGGFVDHHTHVLTHAMRYVWPEVRSWLIELHRRGSNPMDEPWGAHLTGEDAVVAIRDALANAASLGIVEITDIGIPDLDALNAVRLLREREGLPLDVRIFLSSGLARSLGPSATADLHTNDSELDVIGVKFYSDGWLTLRSCALSSPFADDPSNYGLLYLDAETLARRATPFAEAGLQIATHAIGDRAIEEVLDAYEMVFGNDLGDAAPRIEHVEVLRPDLVERIAEMGVVVCIQPSFAMNEEKDARLALGEKRMEFAYAWNALLDAGARVITGSDFPIAFLSPEVGIKDLLAWGVENANDVMTRQRRQD